MIPHGITRFNLFDHFSPAWIAAAAACALAAAVWAFFAQLSAGAGRMEQRALRYLGAFCLLALTLLIVWRGELAGGNLMIVPDSVEYAAGARALAARGIYAIEIESQLLPPRYPPWFSVFGVLPAYLALGNELGNAIFAITLYSCLCMLLAYRLGERISGVWGGLLAGLALLIVPGFRYYSREVMTEIPTLALELLLCLHYLRLASRDRISIWDALAAGVLTALAACFRTPSLTFALPFALLFARRPMLQLALVLPSVKLALATLGYNQMVFGSAFRSGYNLWSPVPYDYPALTFSLSYIPENARMIVFNTACPALLMLFGVWMLRGAPDLARVFERIDTPSAGQMLRFTVLGCLPQMLFYLPYFYPNTRFYFGLEALTVVICGGIAGGLLRHQSLPAWMGVGWLAAALAVVALRPTLRSGEIPQRRLAVGRIFELTPPDAAVISGLDPVYLRAACGPERRFIPVSRRVEYASKLLAWSKVEKPEPPPAAWNDHRSRGLLNGGAKEAVELVALEQPEKVMAISQKLYLESSALAEGEREEVERHFELEPAGENMYRLLPK